VATTELEERRAGAEVAQGLDRVADMAPILRDLRELLARAGAVPIIREVSPAAQRAFSERTGFGPRGGEPVIVVGRAVALELGHPDTESQALALWTTESGLVENGRVTLLGPDLPAMPGGGRWPLGLIVCLELDAAASPDPFRIEQSLRLANRLPGFMVRSLPGRLWARVGASELARGLSLLDVGEALVRAYNEDVPGVMAVEAVIVTHSADAVRSLAPLAIQARVLSGRHKKLYLSPDGALECEELDCEACDERETCDSLRDILARRRESRLGGVSAQPGGRP
jgi:hypothetical protein